MFSTVTIIGRVGRVISPICRAVEVDRIAPKNGRFVVDEIPCIHWTKDDNNYFMNLTEGSYVGLKGRLEVNDEFGGLVVLVEDIATLKKEQE